MRLLRKIQSFYLLPKIRKANNPGRPIVNSIGSVTEKISAFVDKHLRKFTPRIPSYVKDTTHFINITKNIYLEPDDLLVTIYVSSLYTNIPYTEGIASINKMMEETGTDTLLKMLISNLTYQVLAKNFNFNDQLFEQKQAPGWHPAMQSFMHYLETNFLTSYPTPPKIWLRFIDDIFMIWKDGEQQRMFLEALNNYHPTIKFTYTMDKNEIAFLDTIDTVDSA